MLPEPDSKMLPWKGRETYVPGLELSTIQVPRRSRISLSSRPVHTNSYGWVGCARGRGAGA